MRQCRCRAEAQYREDCRRCASKAAARVEAASEIAAEVEDMGWPEDECGPYCPCVIADDNAEFAAEIEEHATKAREPKETT